MIEPLLRRFLEHEKRKQVVIIVTVLTALVIVWPAVDKYMAAMQRTTAARMQLDEANATIAQLDRHTALFERKQQELAGLESQMISEKVAQSLQHQLTELGRQTACTVRKSRLAEAARRDWKEKDHPIFGTRMANSGGNTPFQLETRQLALAVSGPMTGLYRFLERLHQIDKVMHSRTVTIERSSDDGSTAALKMEILLFDLPKKQAKS